MQERVFRTLELDPIRLVLASYARTDPARALAKKVAPSVEPAHIESALADTGESRRLIDEGIQLDFSGITDPEAALSVLAIVGRMGDIDTLLCFAQLTRKARECRSTIRGAEGDYPRLRERVDPLPSLKPLESRISGAIDSDKKEIRDEASETLRRLRKTLALTRRRLQRALDSILQREDTRKLLQEPIVTQRNGRAVVPVRAEFKPRFPGIVHGASTSGATVFVEPMSTVDLNNEIATTQSLIEEECLRILLELTDFAREHRDELAVISETLTELDYLQAKGLLSECMRASQPSLTEISELHLVDGRHPLLIHEVQRRAGMQARENAQLQSDLRQDLPGHDQNPDSGADEPVAISFSLTDGLRTLVLTGPNTGGKTVALKTAGLLALMVQCGLHIPADPSSRFPVFRSVFADIGDEQSIGSSLSTFSAHLKNIIDIDDQLISPSLVILDEVGTGTDPGEGGALGTALVEHFQARGAIVLASTHHHLLKAFATTTDGVQAASFAFDPVTYEPTYELFVGAAGRSMAFEMARRLGLSEAIVERARALQDERERQIGEMVERLEKDRSELEKTKKEIEARLSSVRKRERELELARDEDTAERNRRFTEFQREMEGELADAKRTMKKMIAESRDRARVFIEENRNKELEKLASRSATQLEERSSSTIDRLAVSAGLGDNARVETPPISDALSPGDRVETSLGLQGELIQIMGPNEAEVRVRDKKLRVPIRELRRVAMAVAVSKTAAQSSHRSRPPLSPSTVKTVLHERDGSTELNLIGKTVEEAIELADKFLDDAVLGDYREVRLVHGHGTGRLREALRGWLRDHSQVASVASETKDGATLVVLKD